MVSDKRKEKRQKWWQDHKKKKNDDINPDDSGTFPVKYNKQAAEHGEQDEVPKVNFRGFSSTLPVVASGGPAPKKQKIASLKSDKKSTHSSLQKQLKNKPNKKSLITANTTVVKDIFSSDETVHVTTKEKSDAKQKNTRGKLAKNKKEKVIEELKPSNETLGESTTESCEKSDTEVAGKKGKLKIKKKYHVAFVGNLSYNTSKEEIKKHFNKSGSVKDVRLLTVKGSGKSRGCAYVEFIDTVSLKHGLMLHHTNLGGRQINVEMTLPGRKTQKRTQALKQKNEHWDKIRSRALECRKEKQASIQKQTKLKT